VSVDDDERIVARIEAVADSMPQEPVRWSRVAKLARRKALISAAGALSVAVAIAVLLTAGGSAGSLQLHGRSPFPIPGATVAVPDLHGLDEAVALDRLARAGLDGAVQAPCHSLRRCVVGESDPSAGSNVSSKSSVKLMLRARAPAAVLVRRRPTRSAPLERPAKSTTSPLRPPKHPGEPAKLVLSISRPSIAADGKSTATIEATVLDARGDRLKGQRVAFSSSDPAERIATSPVSGAIGVATVTSSKRAETVTIEARDGALVARIAFEQTPLEEPAKPCNGPSSPSQGGETTETETSTTCTPPTPITTPNTTSTATTPTTTSTSTPSTTHGETSAPGTAGAP
jgi:hypothetical protein